MPLDTATLTPTHSQWTLNRWKRKVNQSVSPNYKVIGRVSSEIQRCNHSYLAPVRLLDISTGTRVKAMAKRHILSPRSVEGGQMHGMVHHPDFLHGRETTNLSLIHQIVGAGYVPVLYGSSTVDKLIVMEHIKGDSDRAKLLAIEQRILESPDDHNLKLERSEVLYQLVQHVARFVGSCTAHTTKFYKEHPQYDEEANLLAGARQEVF